MKKVLVTNLIIQRDLEQFKPLLKRAGIETFSYPVKQFLKEEELLPIINQYDGIIAGDDEYTERVLKRGLPRLKVISKWGVGLDSINLEAAKRLGIKVYNSPGAFGSAVAEVAIGYILMLSRKLHLIDREVRKGKWPKTESEGMNNKVLGIVGFGSIGRETARRALGFGMKILAYDILMEKMQPLRGASFSSFDEILEKSDYLCLSCNLTSDNKGMIGKEELGKMKATAYLVNVSRGGLVDEGALMNALEKNRIAGAALDVYETEPIKKGHPFTKMENVILGSHNANNLRSSNEYVSRNTIKNLIEGLNGSKA
jgi:D-3-phosphoglycerate dehydrogenase